jgi:KipI family sensor histidine kinase inhibitor
MQIHGAGEAALIVYLGDEASPKVAARVQALAQRLPDALGEHLVDLIPSYNSLMVEYDPLSIDHMAVQHAIVTAGSSLDAAAVSVGNSVSLPTYYAPEVGEDLETLAESAGLSVEEVIALHSGTEYRVYAIGFAPGFAYLGEVDERIAAPRLQTPRKRVPRGAVAIADRQTAVYPAPSPGGWNLIGRCPVPLFQPDSDPVMPVGVGDIVRFEPIDRETFLRLGGEL